MSRDTLITGICRILTGLFIPVIICITPATAKAFHSKDEFPAHNLDEGNCFAQECHIDMEKKRSRFQHKPFQERKCLACHLPQVSDEEAPVPVNQRMICSGCHQVLDQELSGSRYIHGPINVGDCTSCHSPHQSESPYLLKEPYNRLCDTCHRIDRLFSGTVIHKPVKDGNCGLCHDPHASNYKSRLTDVGANLCITCHDEMVTGMTMEYVHEPLLTSGCSDCHDPHTGNDALRLKSADKTLCVSCHTEKKNAIAQYNYKHQPAGEGRCTVCHSPHYSRNKKLLRTRVDDLCYQCHKDREEWKQRHFQHGPVVQGNCSACHNPHGSDNAYILRLSFPHKFYSRYEKGEYDLCFLCHKEALVTSKETETVTRFRNGKTNLHALHVNQKKGRTCRACHDVHASDQEDHIREEFRFGTVDIPIFYRKSENGGTCVPGCHHERSYDRMHAIDNRIE